MTIPNIWTNETCSKPPTRISPTRCDIEVCLEIGYPENWRLEWLYSSKRHVVLIFIHTFAPIQGDQPNSGDAFGTLFGFESCVYKRVLSHCWPWTKAYGSSGALTDLYKPWNIAQGKPEIFPTKPQPHLLASPTKRYGPCRIFPWTSQIIAEMFKKNMDT